jgi:ATP-dependent Lon protease
VKEKVLGAHRAGIRHIVLPRANEADIDDVPAEVQRELTFHLADTLGDVLEVALATDTPAESPGAGTEAGGNPKLGDAGGATLWASHG